jgi:hypothetical protein
MALTTQSYRNKPIKAGTTSSSITSLEKMNVKVTFLDISPDTSAQIMHSSLKFGTSWSLQSNNLKIKVHYLNVAYARHF